MFVIAAALRRCHIAGQSWGVEYNAARLPRETQQIAVIERCTAALRLPRETQQIAVIERCTAALRFFDAKKPVIRVCDAVALSHVHAATMSVHTGENVRASQRLQTLKWFVIRCFDRIF